MRLRDRIQLTLLCGGTAVFLLGGLHEQSDYFHNFLEASALVAAYFWIRKDVWRSDGSTADSRVAFLLLCTIAIVQAYPLNNIHRLFFVGTIFVMAPICHFIAPVVDCAFTLLIKYFDLWSFSLCKSKTSQTIENQKGFCAGKFFRTLHICLMTAATIAMAIFAWQQKNISNRQASISETQAETARRQAKISNQQFELDRKVNEAQIGLGFDSALKAVWFKNYGKVTAQNVKAVCQHDSCHSQHCFR